MEKFSTELEFIIMMEFMEFWIWVFVPLCTATFLFASAFRCFFFILVHEFVHAEYFPLFTNTRYFRRKI